MGDSTEEMLKETMKRLDFIMLSLGPAKALESEAYNLIDAAIVLLKTNTEDMDRNEELECWNDLQGYAKSMYTHSLKMPHNKISAGQFHVCNKLMTMIVLCKTEKAKILRYMENEIEEAGAGEPHQPTEKVLKYKNGRPYFD